MAVDLDKWQKLWQILEPGELIQVTNDTNKVIVQYGDGSKNSFEYRNGEWVVTGFVA